MQLERLPNAQAVARRAAELVAEALRARPDAVLLLPAGATPVPLYAELVRRSRAGELELGRAHLFQLDELVGVAPDDARSFRCFFAQHLLEPLGLGARFHALDGAARDPAREIERQRRELAALGAPDLVLLGLGANGHLAFNEPGSLAHDCARVVELGELTREALSARFDEPPRRGITLGLREILDGRRVALLVTGGAKAAILAEVLGAAPSSACPATWLARHPSCTVLADADACAAARAR